MHPSSLAHHCQIPAFLGAQEAQVQFPASQQAAVYDRLKYSAARCCIKRYIHLGLYLFRHVCPLCAKFLCWGCTSLNAYAPKCKYHLVQLPATSSHFDRLLAAGLGAVPLLGHLKMTGFEANGQNLPCA